MFLALALAFTGCSEDEEDPVQTIPSGSYQMTYTVKVLDANETSGGRVAGISGVNVTIVQNGSPVSQTTGNDGTATFTDLSLGTVSGTVSRSGYATMNFTADITPSYVPNITTNEGVMLSSASNIYIFEECVEMVDGHLVGNFELLQTPLSNSIGDFDQLFTGLNFGTALDINDNVNQTLQANNSGPVALYLTYSLTDAYPMGNLTDISMDVVRYETEVIARGVNIGGDAGNSIFEFEDVPQTSKWLEASLSIKSFKRSLDPTKFQSLIVKTNEITFSNIVALSKATSSQGAMSEKEMMVDLGCGENSLGVLLATPQR